MIDHVSFSVRDYQQSLSFYDKSLGALGYKRLMTIDIPEHEVKVAGYGAEKDKRPRLWISPMGKQEEDIGKARGLHLSFVAESKEAIDDWYKICLQEGGISNGEPGPRPEYHPGYYGAFVIDPNGWRIEACFHYYQP